MQRTESFRSSLIPPEALQAMYTALIDFTTQEWVEGYRESGQTCMLLPFTTLVSLLMILVFRNKLSFDLAHLFIATYPSTIPSFLHPFFSLIHSDPSSSTSPAGSPNFDPILLVIHLLNEIALEIHDSTVKSARSWSKERQERDGRIRDVIRSSGDETQAMEGMVEVAEKALRALEGGKDEKGKWLEVGELALRTISAWTRMSRVYLNLIIESC